MIDLNVFAILAKAGHKVLAKNTLMQMNKEELVDYIRCLENNWASALERNNNQFKLLVQKDIDAYTYRWHNVENNPTDLPTVSGRYEIVYQRYDDREVQRDFAFYNCKYGFLSAPNDCLIMWREIEPFEGGY